MGPPPTVIAMPPPSSSASGDGSATEKTALNKDGAKTGYTTGEII